MKFGLREIVFIVLLMGIPVGAWWFIFRPHNQREAEMLKETEAKQAKLRALNQTTGAIGDLKKEIDSLEKAVSFFQSKLPPEKEIDKVLKEVWQLAESNRLITKSIRTLQRTTEETAQAASSPHAEQPIAMQLDGDFVGLYGFLLALENQPRIMRINNMKLKKADKGSEGQMQATLEMSVFFERNSSSKG